MANSSRPLTQQRVSLSRRDAGHRSAHTTLQTTVTGVAEKKERDIMHHETQHVIRKGGATNVTTIETSSTSATDVAVSGDSGQGFH